MHGWRPCICLLGMLARHDTLALLLLLPLQSAVHINTHRLVLPWQASNLWRCVWQNFNPCRFKHSRCWQEQKAASNPTLLTILTDAWSRSTHGCSCRNQSRVCRA